MTKKLKKEKPFIWIKGEDGRIISLWEGYSDGPNTPKIKTDFNPWKQFDTKK